MDCQRPNVCVIQISTRPCALFHCPPQERRNTPATGQMWNDDGMHRKSDFIYGKVCNKDIFNNHKATLQIRSSFSPPAWISRTFRAAFGLGIALYTLLIVCYTACVWVYNKATEILPLHLLSTVDRLNTQITYSIFILHSPNSMAINPLNPSFPTILFGILVCYADERTTEHLPSARGYQIKPLILYNSAIWQTISIMFYTKCLQFSEHVLYGVLLCFAKMERMHNL